MIVYIKNSFKKIMLPFYTAYIFSYLITLLMDSSKRDFTFFIQFLYGGLLGSKWMQVNNFALWFLPMYFISSVLFKYLTNRKDIVVILCGGLSFLLSPIMYYVLSNNEEKIPFSINVIFPALFFMTCGYFFNKYNLFDYLKKNKLIIIFMLSGFIGIYLAFNYPGEILFVKNYWYLIGATLTILFTLWINVDSENKILSYLGRNSLYILLYHRIIIFILVTTNFNQKILGLNISGIMYCFTLSVIVILLSLIPKYIKYGIALIK